MERTTRQHVEAALKAFANEMGGHMARDYKDVGGYTLDKVLGGYQVVQICNVNGGQSCPFGYRRRSAYEMAETLWFTTSALRHLKHIGVSK